MKIFVVLLAFFVLIAFVLTYGNTASRAKKLKMVGYIGLILTMSCLFLTIQVLLSYDITLLTIVSGIFSIYIFMSLFLILINDFILSEHLVEMTVILSPGEYADFEPDVRFGSPKGLKIGSLHYPSEGPYEFKAFSVWCKEGTEFYVTKASGKLNQPTYTANK